MASTEDGLIKRTGGFVKMPFYDVKGGLRGFALSQRESKYRKQIFSYWYGLRANPPNPPLRRKRGGLVTPRCKASRAVLIELWNLKTSGTHPDPPTPLPERSNLRAGRGESQYAFPLPLSPLPLEREPGRIPPVTQVTRMAGPGTDTITSNGSGNRTRSDQ